MFGTDYARGDEQNRLLPTILNQDFSSLGGNVARDTNNLCSARTRSTTTFLWRESNLLLIFRPDSLWDTDSVL